MVDTEGVVLWWEREAVSRKNMLRQRQSWWCTRHYANKQGLAVETATSPRPPRLYTSDV